MMLRTALILLLLTTIPLLLFPQVTIEETARDAQSMNLEIIKAVRELGDAEKDLKRELYLKNSKISIGGGYGYLSPAAQALIPGSRSGFSGSLRVTIPFVPQASLSGEVEVDETGDFSEIISLSLKPFDRRDSLHSEEERYGKALVRLKYLMRQVYNNAERAALDIIVTEIERDQALTAEALEMKKYEVVRQQLEQGSASFQDLQTQLVRLNDARDNLFSTELQLLKNRNNLALLFAPEETDTEIETILLEELIERITSREAELTRLKGLIPSSEKLERLNLELKALRTQLNATPRWTPDAEALATTRFPEFTFSITLGLSFSPGELKNEEREDLDAAIYEKQLDINAEEFSIELQKRLMEQSIEISKQALNSALLQHEKDATSLKESEILFQQGKRTSLELEQVRLNLRQSKIQSFKAASEVYKAQSDFFILFL